MSPHNEPDDPVKAAEDAIRNMRELMHGLDKIDEAIQKEKLNYYVALSRRLKRRKAMSRCVRQWKRSLESLKELFR